MISCKELYPIFTRIGLQIFCDKSQKFNAYKKDFGLDIDLEGNTGIIDSIRTYFDEDGPPSITIGIKNNHHGITTFYYPKTNFFESAFNIKLNNKDLIQMLFECTLRIDGE